MDYTNLLTELNKATTFDLYRLKVAIEKELESPKRIVAIKQKLHIGMELSYFDPVENRLIKATLLEIKQKKVVVFDQEQHKRFIMPFHMLNIEGIDTEIYDTKHKDSLTANTVKVGEYVGFVNKQGENVIGMVKRLNHKTVTLVTQSNHRWRVSYSLLYRVHDAEVSSSVSPKATVLLGV